MATMRPGSTLSASSTEEGWRLRVGDDERGRVRGHEIELDDLDLRIQRTGERSELVTGTGTPVLRFDPAGRKASTLTTSSGRYRLARQRPRPLLRRWRMTRDVHGAEVLTVSQTPLGVRVTVAQDATVDPAELAVLAIGALAEVVDLEPAHAPA